MGIKSLLSTFWRTVSRPATGISLGVLTVGGFVSGIIFWGGFNTALEVTNTEPFCISCHEMRDNVYQELQQTVHWSNRTGVRATCPDCHVPHEWTHKIARKMQASKEVWGTIFGTINTREKFLAKRGELARHEWDRLQANGSRECKNCHDYDSMNWDEMSDEAVFYMSQAAENDTACIECHKGIAHQLPEDMVISSPALARLSNEAESKKPQEGSDYYAIRNTPLYTSAESTNQVGNLTLGAQVRVLEAEGERSKIELSAWRKDKGFGRVLFDDFGHNIRVAVLDKEIAQDDAIIQAGEVKNDDNTGLDWRTANVTLWAENGHFVEAIDDLWIAAEETYSGACSVCHAQPDPAHFSANSWPAQFYGMVGFTNLDADTQTLVLTYLQKHSSDYADAAH